jgi:peptidyl-prolyl cis-trans isomerase SurA
MRWAVAFALLAATVTRAEIVDRIVATVGSSVVTRSDVLLHLRVRAFLDGVPLNLSLAEQRKAVERLVEQALIRREVELSRYPPPDQADVDEMVDQMRKPRLESDSFYQGELARYGITDEQLRQAMLWQLTLLRFVEYRFRPGVQVSDDEIKTYYGREAKAAPEGNAPPPLDDVRDEIEKILIGQRVNEALNKWLEQARSQTPIKIIEEGLL